MKPWLAVGIILNIAHIAQAAASLALPANLPPPGLDTGIFAPAGASVRIAAGGVVDYGMDCSGRGIVTPSGARSGACTGAKHDPSVTLTRGFWMSRYEVTQREYANVTGASPSQFTGDADRPVERVSWLDAVRFCELLNAREHAAGRLLSGYSYRLPTEAEWEYACRAGTESIWNWGNDANESTNYAWHDSNSGTTTHPAGQKLPNPWGLYDMHGNVAEWVWDWPRTYTAAAQVDPVGWANGGLKPLRGGAFNDRAGFIRSGSRWLDHAANNTWHGWGFRTVLASSSPAYFADFEEAVGPEWSANKVSTTPAGGRKYLGDFGNETVTLSLSNLPTHRILRLSFDLFVLRTWDGNTTSPNPGPDIWTLRLRNGPTLVRTTFNNKHPNFGVNGQAYPGGYPGQSHPPFTGAAEINSLGYTFSTLGNFDAVYRQAYEFEHTEEEVSFQFSASGLQGLTDERGLDNVRVELRGEPAAPVVQAQPESQTVAATYPATFVASASGTGPINFQWQKDGVNIAGAANEAWTVPNVTTNHAGAYRLAISNALGIATSSEAVLSVRPPLTMTTLAGQAGSVGAMDGSGAAARFRSPLGMTVDPDGNVYVADYNNHTIRKITAAGVASTFAGSAGQAGSANGAGVAARFNNPVDVARDSSGNLYVADQLNHTIRKINPAGVVTTFAGSPGAAGSANGSGPGARFNQPIGIAVDRADNIYVSDVNNRTVRKITLAGVVTTFAGLAGSSGSADGTGSQARFNSPRGLASDAAGNVYVADNPATIRKITPDGVVSTLAGLAGTSGSADGLGGAARFNGPAGVAMDRFGNIYVPDPANATIRHITAEGLVTTVAGLAGSIAHVNGTGSVARLNDPRRIAVDRSGNIYVSGANQTVRKGAPAFALAPVIHWVEWPVSSGGNSHSYALTTFPGTWLEAEAQAVAHGGHLVTIRNAAEQAFVEKTFLVDANRLRSIWIGLNDVAIEGKFVWSSGEPVSFTRWYAGEPNDDPRFGGEDYVTLNWHYAYSSGGNGTSFGSWNDTDVDGADAVGFANGPHFGIIEKQASPPAVEILTQPKSQTVVAGFDATFTVTAAGEEPLTYQWRKDGVNLEDAASSMLVLTDVTADAAGVYTVLVSNAGGAVVSSSAVLTVIEPPAFAPTPVQIEAGGSVMLNLEVPVGVRVVVEASNDLTDWQTISDTMAKTAFLSVPDPVTISDSRFYRVKYFLP